MSTLVAPLVSGIAGAESGTASFYVYGTNYQTPAIAYDVDGMVLGSSVTLDSHGGAECYVYERVQVLVEDSAGSEVRAFALQTDAASSLISSASLTGVDPSTGAQAAGGEILAASAWDEMRTSFGARDFKVRKTGATADQYLKDALIDATDNFFNVKSTAYGAVGDGSNDDTTMVQAAINAAIAAGGGVVFFPSGTYDIISPLVITSQKVKLLGVGHRASIIRNRGTASNAITISSGSSANCGIVIEDLAITASTSSTGYAVHASVAVGLELRNVRLDLHAVGVRADTRVRVLGGDIGTPASGTVYCVQFDSGGTGDGSEIFGCILTMASTAANGSAILVQRPDVHIRDCSIDSSAGAATTAGIRINNAAALACTMSGNKFAAGASNYGIYVDANVSFNENGGNSASSGTLFGKSSSLTTASGQMRLSRECVTVTSSTSSGTYSFDVDTQYHFVTQTSSPTFQLSPNAGTATHGARLFINIKNTRGGGNCAITASASFAPSSGTFMTIPTVSWAVLEFHYDATASIWHWVGTPAAHTA